jgi:hypothetical protein
MLSRGTTALHSVELLFSAGLETDAMSALRNHRGAADRLRVDLEGIHRLPICLARLILWPSTMKGTYVRRT